jgi:hypothetical protein
MSQVPTIYLYDQKFGLDESSLYREIKPLQMNQPQEATCKR